MPVHLRQAAMSSWSYLLLQIQQQLVAETGKQSLLLAMHRIRTWVGIHQSRLS